MSPLERRLWWSIVTFVLSILFIGLVAGLALANHKDWEWLAQDPVHQNQCCSKDDCSLLTAANVRVVPGGREVSHGGKTFFVPEKRIQFKPHYAICYPRGQTTWTPPGGFYCYSEPPGGV